MRVVKGPQQGITADAGDEETFGGRRILCEEAAVISRT